VSALILSGMKFDLSDSKTHVMNRFYIGVEERNEKIKIDFRLTTLLKPSH
jgi:hypothetical protein